MENFRKWLQLILIVGIIAFLIWFYFDRKDQDKVTQEYWENPNFKTDSIKVDVDYTKLPTPVYKNYVPPKIVVEYTPPDIHTSISLNDSLITVIDSLKKELYTINALYLKLYPTASKLIYGEFNRDSIRLDLLGINGEVTTNYWGTNYQRFTYQYRDGQLRAESVPALDERKYFTEVYGYAGYSLGGPTLGADAALYKAKWRLGANAFMTIRQQPTFNLQGTVGYRLYGTR